MEILIVLLIVTNLFWLVLFLIVLRRYKKTKRDNQRLLCSNYMSAILKKS